MTRYKFWIPLAVILMMACTAAQVSELEQLAEVGASIASDIMPYVAPQYAQKVTDLKTDFTNLVTVYNDVKASLGTGGNLSKLTNAFNTVTKDKVEIEASLNVADPKSLDYVTQGLATIDQALAEIGALIPAQVVAALSPADQATVVTAKATVHAKAQGKKARDLKREWRAYKKAHPLKATK